MTTNTQAKGLRFIAFLRPAEKAGKGNLGTAKDWDVRVDIRRRLKFPEEESPPCSYRADSSLGGKD